MLTNLLPRRFLAYIPSPSTMAIKQPLTEIVVFIVLATKIKDVAAFLGIIRRGCEAHVGKFPTWESLFTMDGEAMEQAGIACKQRKMILRWVSKYRQGIEPYYIRPAIKDRLKMKARRQAVGSTKK